MATFAQIDSNSLVEKLILVSDQDALTEQQGIDFCTATFGSGNYIQTFFDRKKEEGMQEKGIIMTYQQILFMILTLLKKIQLLLVG